MVKKRSPKPKPPFVEIRFYGKYSEVEYRSRRPTGRGKMVGARAPPPPKADHYVHNKLVLPLVKRLTRTSPPEQANSGDVFELQFETGKLKMYRSERVNTYCGGALVRYKSTVTDWEAREVIVLNPSSVVEEGKIERPLGTGKLDEVDALAYENVLARAQQLSELLDAPVIDSSREGLKKHRKELANQQERLARKLRRRFGS